MKKIVSIICIILLMTIEICIPINSYAQEKEENIQNTEINSDEEIDKAEDNTIQNQVEENVVNEENEQIDEINEIENSVVEEENLDELNLEENKVKVQARMNVTGTETIVDGTTNRITTKLTGRVVGTDGGREENGADINLWDDISVSQQRFKFVYYEEGYYKIINEKSGKLLDVVGSGIESGTPVDQWEDNGGYDNQKWIVQDAGNGYYNIISKLNGLYLTVDGNGANCDLLCVKTATGGDDQKFQIVEKGTPQGEKIVEEGTYKIVLATEPTQSLTVDGGRINDGANVHIWEYQNTLQQQFELVYDEEGYYEIIPVHSGKRIDVVGYGNEANVDQWEYNGGNDNQKWVIRKSISGNYNIISKRESLYLDAYQSRTANGTNIQVYEQSRGNGQEFKIEKIEKEDEEVVYEKTVEEGTYKIVLATAPAQSLTVDGGKTNDGANVHIWEYIDTPQQQFNLVYDENGYYEIIPVNSGKRIDVVGYGNEANVDQWANNGGNDNQKWAIVKNKSGNYNIISKREGLYLDAYQSKTANGTNIQVYEKSGGIGQEFKLEKIEDKSERTIADGTYKIAVQANTNLVVEASASNTDNDGRIQIWQDFNVAAQRFNVEYINGYYRISLVHSGKCLTVKWKNISSGTEVVQYEWNEGDNQKWIIRDNGDGSVGIIPLSDYSLTIDIYGAIENGSKLELYNNERNVKQRFTLIKSNLGVNIDMDKYPGIGEAIEKLVAAHPNWQFEILYTGVDFNEAVSGEYSDKERNLVDSGTYQGEWISPDPINKRGWYSASQSAIAYFMDPRNFLNDIDVFQFQDVNSYPTGAVTLDGIRNETSGTFLQGFENDINNACISQNVNPYFVLARLFQEQGRKGSTIGTGMQGPDGKTYYNPYNIGAVTGNEYETALATAMQNGWDTMQKALEAGIVILKENWLENYQNTLYQNKFDIDTRNGSTLYTHQYMQNLSAPYSEGRTLRSCYVNTGTLESNFTFIIPVYENMPQEASPRPSNAGGIPGVTSDKGPIYVRTVNINDIPLKLRSEPSTNGAIIAEFPNNGTILLSVERVNGWYRIVTTDGKVGYSSGAYLEQVADVINCNDRVRVAYDDVRLRYGPGTRFNPPLINAIDESLTGTRINKGTYYLDGFWWDEVIFDDGSKGFVATNYLYVVN